VSIRLARVALAFVLLLFVSILPAGAATLFPEPLHLTRIVDDPVSGQTVVVEEYYQANRVISVMGDRTVIADYARGEVTEIDRAASTYSVTPFLEIARTSPKPVAMPKAAKANGAERWALVPSRTAPSRTGGASRATASTESFDATPTEESDVRKLEVSVDHSVRLSRDAFEVIIGAAYPRERGEQADVLTRAARGNNTLRVQSNNAGATSAPATAETYSLPVEQTVTYEVEGRQFVSRNRVTRIGNELPVPALLTIPPGAQQVELRRIQTEKALQELESPLSSANPPNR
jgi:hypothetical protein